MDYFFKQVAGAANVQFSSLFATWPTSYDTDAYIQCLTHVARHAYDETNKWLKAYSKNRLTVHTLLGHRTDDPLWAMSTKVCALLLNQGVSHHPLKRPLISLNDALLDLKYGVLKDSAMRYTDC
jgi:hypothetical protein